MVVGCHLFGFLDAGIDVKVEWSFLFVGAV